MHRKPRRHVRIWYAGIWHAPYLVVLYINDILTTHAATIHSFIVYCRQMRSMTKLNAVLMLEDVSMKWISASDDCTSLPDHLDHSSSTSQSISSSSLSHHQHCRSTTNIHRSCEDSSLTTDDAVSGWLVLSAVTDTCHHFPSCITIRQASLTWIKRTLILWKCNVSLVKTTMTSQRLEWFEAKCTHRLMSSVVLCSCQSRFDNIQSTKCLTVNSVTGCS